MHICLHTSTCFRPGRVQFTYHYLTWVCTLAYQLSSWGAGNKSIGDCLSVFCVFFAQREPTPRHFVQTVQQRREQWRPTSQSILHLPWKLGSWQWVSFAQIAWWIYLHKWCHNLHNVLYYCNVHNTRGYMGSEVWRAVVQLPVPFSYRQCRQQYWCPRTVVWCPRSIMVSR